MEEVFGFRRPRHSSDEVTRGNESLGYAAGGRISIIREEQQLQTTGIVSH